MVMHSEGDLGSMKQRYKCLKMSVAGPRFSGFGFKYFYYHPNRRFKCFEVNERTILDHCHPLSGLMEGLV